jgi:uncharacterized membrane-anchored protein
MLIFGLSLSAYAEGQAGKQEKLQWQKGPLQAQLGEQAQLQLPAAYSFLDAKQTRAMLARLGHDAAQKTFGMVVEDPEADKSWAVILEWEDGGLVKDDDAKTWTPEAVFNTVVQTYATINIQAASIGMPEFKLNGWAAKPQYDPAKHQLVWGLAGDSEGQPLVRYHAVLLGREGYLSVSMATTPADLPAYQAKLQALLAGITFLNGKRYEDFNATKDKASSDGLTALVAETRAASKVAATLGPWIERWRESTALKIAALLFVTVAFRFLAKRAMRSSS